MSTRRCEACGALGNYGPINHAPCLRHSMAWGQWFDEQWTAQADTEAAYRQFDTLFAAFLADARMQP